MKATSTIRYTLENKHGDSETFNDLNHINTEDEVMIKVALRGENDFIHAPLLPGYDVPYDFAVTDEIGTEHFIYYNEKNSYELNIFESDTCSTPVGTLKFDTYRQMMEIFFFLDGNNKNNKWKFEMLKDDKITYPW